MSLDNTDILEFVIGGVAAAGTMLGIYLNAKTNKMQDDHIAHVLAVEKCFSESASLAAGQTLYAEKTFAKTIDMTAGFAATAAATAAAAKVAETFSKDLNAKVDKTQEAVHRVEVVQAGQSENMKNMDKNIQTIADSVKKE